MKISEEQLKIWATSPGTSRAEDAYRAIKTALESSKILAGRKIEIYLQGSYGNHTNIKADSDIDVVVQLNSVWRRDISRLTQQEQEAYISAVSKSSYGIDDFRRDVLQSLRNYFNQSVIDDTGNKSIKLRGNNSRLHADIVPALQHRIYTSFVGIDVPTFLEGIKLKAKDGTEIENYPKLHIANGENKNAKNTTGENYKYLVRVIKNIRKKLEENKIIPEGLAPSYFIECLIYNVPNGYFSNDYQASVTAILRFLQEECNPDALITGSHQHTIFGDKPWQWNNKDDAILFLGHVKNFLGT